MTSTNRGDRIQLLHKVVKKYYTPIAPPEGRPLLEHLIFACCLEDARYEAADEAFHRLQESYFDWNEIRVTTVTELGEVLHNLPDPMAAGARVKRNLQSIFETRYSFDIEDMRKMNQGKAVQELEKFGGMSKFVLGYLVQNAFGGHTIPVGSSVMHVLVATGIVTQQEAHKHNTPGLDRAISKSKGLEFASCLHQLAADIRAQPHSKNLKLILKEAGAVDAPKRPAIAPVQEKKTDTKKGSPLKEVGTKEAASKSVEKPVSEKPGRVNPIAEKPTTKKSAEHKPAGHKPAGQKPAEQKPAEQKPVTQKPAIPKASPERLPSTEKKTPGHLPAKKDTAKKLTSSKKSIPQKISKRKPK